MQFPNDANTGNLLEEFRPFVEDSFPLLVAGERSSGGGEVGRNTVVVYFVATQ